MSLRHELVKVYECERHETCRDRKAARGRAAIQNIPERQ